MTAITRQISLDVSSDPNAGARNINASGSQFDIILDQAIQIPADAFNATVRVEEATVWNSVNNISVTLGNNTFYIVDGGVTTPVVLRDGNYNTEELRNEIQRESLAAGLPFGLISLDEDFASQRVVLVVDGNLATAPGAQVDFTPADTPRALMGFTAALFPAAPVLTLTFVDAPNRASFNTIEYFKIHSDVGEGIRSNTGFDQTVARINIDAPPGTQVVSEIFNPARSEANALIGADRNTFRFWITDQANNLVETNEIWSARLVIEYQELVFEPRAFVAPQPLQRRAEDDELGERAPLSRLLPSKRFRTQLEPPLSVGSVGGGAGVKQGGCAGGCAEKTSKRPKRTRTTTLRRQALPDLRAHGSGFLNREPRF